MLLAPVVYASPAPWPILVLNKESPTSILPVLNVAIPAIPIVTPLPTRSWPPDTLTPALAVTIPTESILVTS